MHHYIFILFLCVMGAKEAYQYKIISTGHLATYDIGNMKCDLPVPDQFNCRGFKTLRKRYSYHKETGKCVLVEIPSCFSGNGNLFPSRKECLQLCNAGSDCLKPGNGSITVFHYKYNQEKDTCDFIIPTVHKGRLDTAIGNAFPDRSDCESACTPTKASLARV
uniref:Pancreatic trypsin inhibitor n=1 Tax=Rhipicephalus zambeziensis TaxID=60191 RepID=A0A224YCZ0_9ACAR